MPLGILARGLVAAIATYFLVNTGLVAGAIGLSSRRSVWVVWYENFLWSAPSFMVAGGAGGLDARRRGGTPARGDPPKRRSRDASGAIPLDPGPGEASGKRGSAPRVCARCSRRDRTSDRGSVRAAARRARTD